MSRQTIKISIQVDLPPSAVDWARERIIKVLPAALEHDLMRLARAYIPDGEQGKGDPEVKVVIQ